MDDEGIDLPDLASLRSLLRATLTAILHDEGGQTGIDEFSAQAFDEAGRVVMTARASVSITDQ
jgi:hypothetical protein